MSARVPLIGCLFVLLVLVAAAPAAAHAVSGAHDREGYNDNGHKPRNAEPSPLRNFKWITPEKLADGRENPNDAMPCEPAWQVVGYPLVDGQAATHIAHITGFSGLDPSSNYIVGGSTDFFHIDTGYQNIGGIEEGGTPSDYMLTSDGYARFEMHEPIYDNDGRDIRIGDFHNYSSYCLWGSPEPDGPWMFIGSAFKESDPSASYMDLKFFYNDMWKKAGLPGLPYAQYMLLQGSIDKFPVLNVKFVCTPGSPILPGTAVECVDESEVYGWPKKEMHDEATPEEYTDLDGDGKEETDTGYQTAVEIQDNNPDQLKLHQWWFDDDRTAASGIDMNDTAHHEGLNGAGHNPPSPQFKFYEKPGDYDVCERVRTKHGLVGEACITIQVVDPPPVAAFVARSVGCYWPSITFLEKSLVFGADSIVAAWWDLGDGTLATGKEVTHIYEETGIYNVTLRVMDDDDQEDVLVKKVFAMGKVDCGDPPVRSGDRADPSRPPEDSRSAPVASFDADEDGIPDEFDSCPTVSDLELATNVADLDGDAVGDACDDDLDGDGVLNLNDLCPVHAETSQTDLDDDGIGDVCDEDADGDGLKAGVRDGDLCPFVSDPLQADLDGDGVGDGCDADRDGDRVDDLLDAFPDRIGEWADRDGNGIGDNEDLRRADEAGLLFGRPAASVAAPAARDAGTGAWPLLALGLVALAALGRRR